jgi:hypothetical protein
MMSALGIGWTITCVFCEMIILAIAIGLTNLGWNQPPAAFARTLIVEAWILSLSFPLVWWAAYRTLGK